MEYKFQKSICQFYVCLLFLGYVPMHSDSFIDYTSVLHVKCPLPHVNKIIEKWFMSIAKCHVYLHINQWMTAL